MAKNSSRHPHTPPARKRSSRSVWLGGVLALALGTAAVFTMIRRDAAPVAHPAATDPDSIPVTEWLRRALLIDDLFHRVYTAGWEGANGALGDAEIYAVTHDGALLDFYARRHPLTAMFNGTWVDDRAWICLAELSWWDVTGRNNVAWVTDAVQRYLEARQQGRLSRHEGYWSWYNWPPGIRINDQIFTNSNMNQMVAVACGLYEATGHRGYLDDALLVWKGDGTTPGIVQKLYRGNGVWEGNQGRAAFGKELPWGGTSYCSIAAALFRATGDTAYKTIAVATARHIMDPATGWVDPRQFYQLRMDGNGNFVQCLLDAYRIAPGELSGLPHKIARMLNHVWTNDYGGATVTLHRESDHGIRNGWNPRGGEDGYGVGEIGTVHAQSQAVRAYGAFVHCLVTPR
jgi:hypothetical protein